MKSKFIFSFLGSLYEKFFETYSEYWRTLSKNANVTWPIQKPLPALNHAAAEHILKIGLPLAILLALPVTVFLLYCQIIKVLPKANRVLAVNAFIFLLKKMTLSAGADFFRLADSLTFLHHLDLSQQREISVKSTITPPRSAFSDSKIFKTKKIFETIVIGSGPAGATIAWELTKNGREVLCLEAGPTSATHWIPFSSSQILNNYKNGGLTTTLGKPRIAFAEGIGLGGGSEVNSGLYHRLPAQVLEDWKTSHALKDIDYRLLENTFGEIEKELSVQYSRPPSRASVKLEQGARAKNWNVVEVPRWYVPTHSNTETHWTPQSMAKTYLEWALQSGLQLKLSQKVRFLKRRGHLWELTVSDSENRESIFTAKHVILAAGATGSPSLLLRSGLGNENVGKNVQLHPTAKWIAEFPEPVFDPLQPVGTHQVKHFAPQISMGCSVATLPHLACGFGDRLKQNAVAIENWQNYSVYYSMIKPTAVGNLKNRLGQAWIKYKLNAKDLKALSEGMKYLSQILFEAGAIRLHLQSNSPFELITPTLDYLPHPEKMQLMSIHLFGGCAIGENRKNCVANSWGEVFEAPHLYIADASILPSAIGVNPQGTIIAFAKRIAQGILTNTRPTA